MHKTIALSLAALTLTAGIAAATHADPAIAASPAKLGVGSKAPMFTTTGARAGKAFSLNLASTLKKGPVVLYFFPKAFTSGCTAEAHEFATRMDEFKKAGATVIGLSADGIEELKKFSTEACQSKFAVARATPQMINAYGVGLPSNAAMTGRTSMVIAPNGRITFIHNDMDYRDHVKLTLGAVQSMAKRTKG
ncbi:peroxiredoxin [Blastomonas sp.]|uniref:peroxiredoxin n=1 Tax=Blastomonas sp. TaxID=1909299 RepID=UPI00359375B0